MEEWRQREPVKDPKDYQMNLEVTRKAIPDILALLDVGEWQVPGFQREFVWSVQQVHDLLTSIFKSRPVGMITAWAQPQGQPTTDPTRIEIKGEKFGTFKETPAVIKLILDGKQRLTSLAIAFGGLKASKGNQLFSGSWYLDFTKNSDESDEFIKYKKKSEVTNQKLDQIPNCLALGLLPLDQYSNFNKLSQRIFDKDYYPAGKVPTDEELERRSSNLARCQSIFNGYQIPVAELPSSVGLSDICEIFEVLNTKGTKVSTFDLIHNTFFGKTGGQFSLRDKFEELSKSTAWLGLLLTQSRPEFLCQMVTGIYLSTEMPKKRDAKTESDIISSIKGKDLLDTPLSIYEEFLDNVALVDSWVGEFFQDILGAELELENIPYPASIILYFSLRWRQSKVVSFDKRFSVEQLTRFYRAFFWRNVFSNRYEQGFLTKFATDLRDITAALEASVKLPQSEWSKQAQGALDKIMGPDYEALGSARLQEIMVSDEQRGATWQGLVLFIISNVKVDLLDGKQLNRLGAPDDNGTELHHIYPRQWLMTNAANDEQEKQYKTALNSIANQIPLSSKSNKKWSAQSPSAFIYKQQISWSTVRERAEAAFINENDFINLKDDKSDPPTFWKNRSESMAKALSEMQRI
jgi:hypothetical protein